MTTVVAPYSPFFFFFFVDQPMTRKIQRCEKFSRKKADLDFNVEEIETFFELQLRDLTAPKRSYFVFMDEKRDHAFYKHTML